MICAESEEVPKQWYTWNLREALDLGLICSVRELDEDEYY